jgi:radical SAM superfamily enzyme YgiQ (UPF0313 family)
MADITLVNLNMLFVRYVDGTEKELHFPLGLLYLVTALEKAGMSVDFRDYQFADCDDRFAVDSIAEFCKNPAPVIGLSCMANLLPFAILAARELKARYPGRTVILGGVGPKFVERKILDRFPWIDMIAYGEGEESCVELVRATSEGNDLSTVPGLFYRADGQIRQTATAERIADLDTTGYPAFHHTDVKRYDAYGMITSRGCPYLCTFCSVAPIWGRKPTFRSVDDIIAEMRLLHEETGTDLFLFQDEFFVASKRRTIEFCEKLKKSGLELRWKAFGRVDITDEETMKAMSGCGCIEIRYGIESGSDAVLERVKKGFTVREATDVVSTAATLFPRVDAFFIWGYPFETIQDFHQSVFLMISFRLMGARILPSLLSLLPQTDIYEEYREDPKLEFSDRLMPEYMLTGHEVCLPGRISLPERYTAIFDFVRRHRDLFPGFCVYDFENNILPKYQVLQEHGFYTRERPELTVTDASEPRPVTELDSCGAHSPRVSE